VLPTDAPRRRLRRLGAVWLLALAGCAGRSGPPEPGSAQGVPPDLRGVRVMVLPVQDIVGVEGDPDAEIAFGLSDRAPTVGWILPARLEEVLARAPGMATRVRGLPVGAFFGAEVRRVGDPLYGELRRLAALSDATVALIPLRASAEPQPAGYAVRFTTAAIHAETGRVLWFGVVEGEAHPAGDPRALASAVDRLAATLLWYTRPR